MEPRIQAQVVAAVIVAAAFAGALWVLWPEPPPPQAVRLLHANEEDAGASGNAEVAEPMIQPDAGAVWAQDDGGTSFARLSWGSGPGQVGRRLEDGTAGGPMSLAVDPSGQLLVLDNVNMRVLRVGPGGVAQTAFELPVRAGEELRTTADGRVVVMDRLADRSIVVLDPDGTLRAELALEGRQLPDSSAITAMIVEGAELLVERDRGPLVRLGDADGNLDEVRPELPGRPSRDGTRYFKAGLADALGGRVYLKSFARPSLEAQYAREYRLGVPVVQVLALESDGQGTLYLSVLAQPPKRRKKDPVRRSVRLLCLDADDGAPLGQVSLPANPHPEASFRDLAVLEQGGVIYAHRTEEGVSYERADCR